MARGGTRGASPVPELPKVSFKKVEDDFSTPKNGVHDQQARSYGYNDFSDFQRPEYYIRHIEPLEIDLARQVEYDMDEQDKEWLDALNAERKKEQVDKVSYEVFEIIMDRLEKEWFDLTKNIPKADFAMPSEDSTCAICDDSEGENSNAIVFCDGCNLAVHQDCYGVPYIPEGQWLCRKCTVSPENPVSCILCPNEGGAFKQTVNGEWVHLLCAIWVPETRVANEVFMEPVTGVEKISKQRWKLRCSICDIREGACIQCAKTSCFLAFHTTCARKEKLLLPMKSTAAESVTLTCYCDKHLPKEQQDARAAALAAEEEEEEDELHPSKLSKSARAYAKTYKPGPPLVPNIIVDRISQYISKVVLRKKYDFLLLVCRYWSLKREARRGAPLLKRLHLEPWTANGANNKLQSEEERAMKLEQLRMLQKDLESVRELTKLTWKRETRKQQQLEIIQEIFSTCLFPHEPPLRLAFERIVGLDKNDYFKNPVSKAEVPDYFDIITRPMCWTVIDERLDKHEYWDIKDFKDDIELVLDNAMLYNKPGTPFYKTAGKIRNAAGPILEGLERLSTTKYLPPASSEGKAHAEADGETKVENPTPVPSAIPSVSLIGDLEPPLELLELLFSLDAVKDDIPLLLNTDPISSLFNYEFPVFKPPPPPPPPAPPKPRKGKAPKSRTAKDRVPGLEGQFQIPPESRKLRTRSSGRVEASPISGSSLSGEDFGASTSSAIHSLRSKKSIAEPLPSHPGLLEDVDKQHSFKYFNAGWILPADQKRGGRIPAAERPAVPPPKKKMRVDRAASGLSVFSTTEEDNQTLEHGESTTVDGQISAPQSSRSDAVSVPVGLRALSQAAAAAAADESMQMDVDQGQPVNDLPLDTQIDTKVGPSSEDIMKIDDELLENPLSYIEEGRLPPIGTVIRANGKVIIEELDSPATRREKNLRRKAERARLKQAASFTEPELGLEPEPEPSTSALDVDAEPAIPDPSSSSVVKKADKGEAESDLSSLSEDDGARGKEASQSQAGQSSSGPLIKKEAQTSSSVLATTTQDSDPGAILLGPGQDLEGGTLVWAKADTFPWWPAVVFERDDPKIPKGVKKIADNVKKKKKKEAKMYFVRFFDKQQSWQYVDTGKLKMLGEDSALDEDLLAPTSRRQRWKNTSIRNECREAFRKAQQEMETDGGGDGEEEEGTGVESDAVEPTQE